MNTESCTVLLVDDHPLFRCGVAQLIAAQPDFEVVGEAASSSEGVSMAASLKPDLVLMDLHMRDSNGLDALKQIKESGLDTHVIMLTVSDAEQDFVRAVRAGAEGYLLKGSEPEEILDKLRQAARGETVFTEPLMSMLVGAMRGGTPAPPTNEECLTTRERQILRLIAAGKSNKHIARELDISDGTVKVHVKNLLRKLNLQSRLEAAVWALTNS
ncbi:two-component system response regulator [Methyloceanibacter superfactus]|jgi:two-component system, NarL family, nitrate/nitrite response regulator NarL|uniref:Two-component system response regulator n=1 Tax=Methyloceanibacter superfactus TaxID=1774969 RepID=A0A1E3W844_9HYPH|nr:two-component system response regulator NarL [Methyloceanibacter superfactus]ODS01277.1 two-component system response regulator [Methyloceanibacter superfactus]